MTEQTAVVVPDSDAFLQTPQITMQELAEKLELGGVCRESPIPSTS